MSERRNRHKERRERRKGEAEKRLRDVKEVSNDEKWIQMLILNKQALGEEAFSEVVTQKEKDDIREYEKNGSLAFWVAVEHEDKEKRKEMGRRILEWKANAKNKMNLICAYNFWRKQTCFESIKQMARDVYKVNLFRKIVCTWKAYLMQKAHVKRKLLELEWQDFWQNDLQCRWSF